MIKSFNPKFKQIKPSQLRKTKSNKHFQLNKPNNMCLIDVSNKQSQQNKEKTFTKLTRQSLVTKLFQPT